MSTSQQDVIKKIYEVSRQYVFERRIGFERSNQSVFKFSFYQNSRRYQSDGCRLSKRKQCRQFSQRKMRNQFDKL